MVEKQIEVPVRILQEMLDTWEALSGLLDAIDLKGQLDDFPIEHKHGKEVYKAYLNAEDEFGTLGFGLEDIGIWLADSDKGAYLGKVYEVRRDGVSPGDHEPRT